MPKNDTMDPPQNLPERGFYYHYKHDPAGPLNNYAYEVLGTGCATETDWKDPDAYMVIYRPLYGESPAYQAGRLWFLRPAAMFMGDIPGNDGAPPMPRFHKICNPEIVAELMAAKERMYGKGNGSRVAG